MKMIIKRDGTLQPLDIKKIQKYTSDAVKGLSNVSQSELELDAHIQFNDRITSQEIQNTLIKTAVDKIDIDRPNWTFVAARLFNYDLKHRVGKTIKGTKGQAYCHLKDYFEYGEKEGKIILGLKELYDLDILNDYIKSERDELFNYLGIRTLYDRYLLKDRKGNPFELPQQMFMGISMFLAQREKEEERTNWAIKFYDMISTFEVMLATPTLSNARTPKHQLSSCYVGSSTDNIEGIFDSYKEMALLSKYGGGIGWDWTQVRAMGGSIDGHNKAAGGTIPFLKITNDIAVAVDQLGCVAKNSYVEVLTTVETNTGNIHNFRKEYIKVDLTEKEKMEEIASFAASFAFDYGKYNKNFISSLLYDYVLNDKNIEFLYNLYNLDRNTYKKIIGKYKKINKGLPTGFKILKEFENYAISKDGIVISLITLKPLATQIDRKGYVRIGIGKNSIALHKLLVKEFLEIETDGLTIDHIDDNKLNNSLDNFNIISNEENISKSWLSNSSIRKEKIRIKGYLSHNKKINGFRTSIEDNIEIKEINTKKIKIENLRIGDLVKSYNVKTNNVEFKEVLAVHDIEVKHKNQIKLTFKDNSYVVTSKWHPTYIKQKNKETFNFIRADEVNIGDFGLNANEEEIEIIDIDLNPCYDENYKDLTIKDNNNYFAATDNKSTNFYLIHNTRKGAIAVYMEPWHLDILDFLDLRKNSGEERRRAHDLFPALWINDLFMKRVKNNETWTLFDSFETKQLLNLYGNKFEKEYLKLEKNDKIRKETINAKDLWKKILTSYFETGSPFLCFKDNANNANQNNHSGIIRSSNLCTEIFQNTNPNEYKVKITYENGEIEIFDENEVITTDTGMVKKANKLTSIDKLKGKQIIISEKEKIDGDTAVCNLASVNLSKINQKEDIERIIPIAIRALDNVIDLNFYPLDKVRKTNAKTRAIGLGVMGEAQMLAENKIHWGSKEHFNKIDEIMEIISYNAISSSSELAIEKGSYPQFEGSKWSKGILPIDYANEKTLELTNRKYIYDWNQLRKKVKNNGMRNGYLMAVAPTSSISILVGTTQAIEPVFKRKWFEENLSGLIPVVVPNLNIDTWEYYIPAFELDQRILIQAGAIRQKWIDQGQSLNIFVTLDKASGKYLNEIYSSAWEYGCKSTYYLRSQSPQMKEEVVDRSIECTSCQ